jgi:hypothetical protein
MMLRYIGTLWHASPIDPLDKYRWLSLTSLRENPEESSSKEALKIGFTFWVDYSITTSEVV